MPQPGAARNRRYNHPADHHITALGLWVQQAQVSDQLVVLPGHQVMGVAFQVLPVEILVDAFLLNDKHLVAQAQDGVKLFLAEVIVMFADPFNCHGVFSYKCLFPIVSAAGGAV